MNKTAYPELFKNPAAAAETNYVNLKTNLKKLIVDNNLNAIKLSKLTNIPKSTLSDWLLGNSPKNIAQVKTVADHFGITIDELVFGASKNKKAKPVEQTDLLNFGNFDVYLKKRE